MSIQDRMIQDRRILCNACETEGRAGQEVRFCACCSKFVTSQSFSFLSLSMMMTMMTTMLTTMLMIMMMITMMMMMMMMMVTAAGAGAGGAGAGEKTRGSIITFPDSY